jgi:uncharacterized protein YyaL (SSP411 family)
MTAETSQDRRSNRLINEKSPYLLQHAHNPVDWYPWGDEAFTKARAEEKLIFLSIGYSTCHWCHVMEKESFEDNEVARLLNNTFVCIKVDREERPDIDSVYMSVCQAMTGSGGWPLSMIITPDKNPIYAATYIPKESKFGRLGMLELIPGIKEIWGEKKNELEKGAAQITSALEQVSQQGDELSEDSLHDGYNQLYGMFDEEQGGFGNAPKFPTPHNLMFLLRYWKRTGDEMALHMVKKTLDGMRNGGMYDHIGFGFHRYSTDAGWLVPHFEKMLYDQALLGMVYVEAFQVTGDETYGNTAREILTYVLKDMTDDNGGFYSAEDADSEGEEGKFYVWSEEEIRQLLSEPVVEFIIKAFNVEKGGNFSEEVSGRRMGKNILHIQKPLDKVALDLNIPETDIREHLDTARQQLFAAREQRTHPHKDDKILTDWNGLMIAALAKGAQVLDEPEYTRAAKRSADFILGTMRDADGKLYHRFRDGEMAVGAFLDDYAFLIWGLVELYETTFEEQYLQEAVDLTDDMIAQFWDDEHGAFYFTSQEAEDILVRKKEIYDGAVPSGNSVAMLVLLRLGRMIANPELEEKAVLISRTFSNSISNSPAAYTMLLVALDFALGPANEIVIAGESNADDTRSMIWLLRNEFTPNTVVIFRPTEILKPNILDIVHYAKDLSVIDNKATAYVCQNYHCELPTTDERKMLELLR